MTIIIIGVCKQHIPALLKHGISAGYMYIPHLPSLGNLNAVIYSCHADIVHGRKIDIMFDMCSNKRHKVMFYLSSSVFGGFLSPSSISKAFSMARYCW